MGERSWTTLQIGGQITASKLADLTSLIEYHFEEDDDDDLAVRSKRPLSYSGMQRNGEVDDEVLDWLTANNLTWKVHCEGVAGCYEAELTAWRPGFAVPLRSPCDNDGSPAVTLRDLKNAYEDGHSLSAVIYQLQRADIPVPPIEVTE